MWGHLPEEDYLARRRHLEEVRSELQETPASPAIPIPIQGIGQAWQLADAARRRALLGVFFEKLYVADGAITKYVARREYTQEVEALIGLAVGDGLEYEVPITGRGTNLKREYRASDLSVLGGKGGIRTHEGASNPLPA